MASSTLTLAHEVLTTEAAGITALLDHLDDNFEKAIDYIMACPTRTIIAGIGKSGIIGQKIAATMNSTGTTAFFLHPVEAMHGDLGIVDSRDVLLAISYSGETTELNRLVTSVKGRGLKVIAMTGNPHSTLGKNADAVLNIGIAKEACPLGLAPTTSTTATLAMGDALAVVLLDRKQFNKNDFRKNHPGGSLGERLKVHVSEVMMTGDSIPKVTPDTSLPEAIFVLNKESLGAVLVLTPEKKVIGILTDGDIRRLVASDKAMNNLTVRDVMTTGPKHIRDDLLAADALSIMQHHEVTILPVLNKNDELAGLLHLHNLLGKGEFRLLV